MGAGYIGYGCCFLFILSCMNWCRAVRSGFGGLDKSKNILSVSSASLGAVSSVFFMFPGEACKSECIVLGELPNLELEQKKGDPARPLDRGEVGGLLEGGPGGLLEWRDEMGGRLLDRGRNGEDIVYKHFEVYDGGNVLMIWKISAIGWYQYGNTLRRAQSAEFERLRRWLPVQPQQSCEESG